VRRWAPALFVGAVDFIPLLQISDETIEVLQLPTQLNHSAGISRNDYLGGRLPWELL
jgi:hypothetical protein